jgi:beta-glucanase (GH16 family)
VQLDAQAKGNWKAQPGTGTEYRSNSTTGIVFASDATPGVKSLVVSSIVADCPELVLPDWLGKRPPVDGDWTMTLKEEFDGNAIDLHRWNVHSSNWWDKRMHFSKDQVIVSDGTLKLRLEKKPGNHNDDPKGAYTQYAAGQPDTYGKWTQRYGYFEIRQKQPTAKCLWPGFWMMPDRGLKSGGTPGKRGSTANGGMEFDITESQSSWGIHRFNIACHWDNYGKEHKAIGTSANYVQADKDGFIVVGLLWTPGSYVIYGNGREIFRWDSPRVSSQQASLILQNEIGGWDNEEVDDSQLPADYVVDYIRVWQRKDLASPEDGPKPNKGDMDAFHETLPAADAAK